METCNVCCEKYTKKKNKKITCKFCKYEQCIQCTKRYLLSIDQSKCMNCNVQWNQEYLQEIFSKNFINKQYKEYKQKLMVDNEKKYYPQYMQIIKDQKTEEEINNKIKKTKKEIANKKKDYQRQRYLYKPRPYNILCPNKICDKENIQILTQCCEYCKRDQVNRCKIKGCNRCYGCKTQICQNCLGIKERNHTCQCITDEERKRIKNDLTELRRKLKEQVRLRQKDVKERQSREIQHYYIACPRDECKGYIQIKKSGSEQEIKCIICSTQLCKKCNKKMLQNHECKEDDVITTQKIIQECKQCPKCHSNIYKIEGCNDMFCTICKASFNWRTGKEQTPAHNPHYFEYIRNNDIQLHNEEMIAIINAPNVIQKMRRQKRDSEYIDTITDQARYINHISTEEIPALQLGIQQSNQELSMQYLLSKIDIKKYKKILFQRKKRQEKNIEYIQILEAYVNIGGELIQQIFTKQKKQDIKQEIQQIKNLYNCVKENLDKAKKRYNSRYTIRFFS